MPSSLSLSFWSSASSSTWWDFRSNGVSIIQNYNRNYQVIPI
jgi:hypothetical protein